MSIPTANEARITSTRMVKAKNYIKEIGNLINSAINKSEFEVGFIIDDYQDIENAVIKQLIALGYKVESERYQEDDRNHLIISWK